MPGEQEGDVLKSVGEWHPGDNRLGGADDDEDYIAEGVNGYGAPTDEAVAKVVANYRKSEKEAAEGIRDEIVRGMAGKLGPNTMEKIFPGWRKFSAAEN